MSKDCIFCKMVQGSIPVTKLYEDEDFFCIRDIQPQAKVHLLLIPKIHIPSIIDGYSENENMNSLVGSLMKAATRVAKQEGLWPGGFRSVINTGENGGQSVFHLHLHLLGGEVLRGRFGS
jgi:histidine triad (HIT) family protein